MENDNKLKAKKKVVSAIRDWAKGEMGNKLKGMQKVTVASDSPEGLKKGLEKAEEMVEEKGLDIRESKGGSKEEFLEAMRMKKKHQDEGTTDYDESVDRPSKIETIDLMKKLKAKKKKDY